jgi:GxxExxY protein
MNDEEKQKVEEVAKAVVDAAFKVHTTLGPGLLETVYEVCLVHELHRRGLRVETQVALPIEYDGFKLDAALRLDLVVEDRLIIELKAVESLLPIHMAQMMTYLKLTRRSLGLLINFNVSRIKDGIRRVIL